MDPNVWFPIVIMGMVAGAIIIFGLLLYFDKGD
jgi:hypothetical protein